MKLNYESFQFDYGNFISFSYERNKPILSELNDLELVEFFYLATKITCENYLTLKSLDIPKCVSEILNIEYENTLSLLNKLKKLGLIKDEETSIFFDDEIFFKGYNGYINFKKKGYTRINIESFQELYEDNKSTESLNALALLLRLIPSANYKTNMLCSNVCEDEYLSDIDLLSIEDIKNKYNIDENVLSERLKCLSNLTVKSQPAIVAGRIISIYGHKLYSKYGIFINPRIYYGGHNFNDAESCFIYKDDETDTDDKTDSNVFELTKDEEIINYKTKEKCLSGTFIAQASISYFIWRYYAEKFGNLYKHFFWSVFETAKPYLPEIQKDDLYNVLKMMATLTPRGYLKYVTPDSKRIEIFLNEFLKMSSNTACEFIKRIKKAKIFYKFGIYTYTVKASDDLFYVSENILSQPSNYKTIRINSDAVLELEKESKTTNYIPWIYMMIPYLNECNVLCENQDELNPHKIKAMTIKELVEKYNVKYTSTIEKNIRSITYNGKPIIKTYRNGFTNEDNVVVDSSVYSFFVMKMDYNKYFKIKEDNG